MSLLMFYFFLMVFNFAFMVLCIFTISYLHYIYKCHIPLEILYNDYEEAERLPIKHLVCVQVIGTPSLKVM